MHWYFDKNFHISPFILNGLISLKHTTPKDLEALCRSEIPVEDLSQADVFISPKMPTCQCLHHDVIVDVLTNTRNTMTPTLSDLYPDLNDEQLAEVEDTLECYLELVLRIFERLEHERRLQPSSKNLAMER